MSYNRIGNEGVKHLANALRENTVINVLFSLLSQTTIFHYFLESYRTKSIQQSNWITRSKGSGKCT